MPAYIVLGSWTDQGVRAAKDTVNRFKGVEKALEAIGGKKIGMWWTLGQYDFVFIFSAPDDETATRLLITVGTQGNVRTHTMRCFSEDEAARIVQGV